VPTPRPFSRRHLRGQFSIALAAPSRNIAVTVVDPNRPYKNPPRIRVAVWAWPLILSNHIRIKK